MKTTILICLLAFSLSSVAQTIRRCNHNLGITGVNVYATIQAAHDNANIGDIIYVEPSSTSYGSLIATKRLTIVGAGHSLAQNINTSFDKRESAINSIVFNAGTANSVVIGISILGSGITIKDANITITKCLSGSIFLSSTTNANGIAVTIADNTIISNCFETGNIYGEPIGTLTGSRFVTGTIVLSI